MKTVVCMGRGYVCVHSSKFLVRLLQMRRFVTGQNAVGTPQSPRNFVIVNFFVKLQKKPKKKTIKINIYFSK
jgi:hypothetical protein